MVSEVVTKNELLKGLPDISQEVKDVFEGYFEACGQDVENAKPFLDAWLNMQKEQGINLFYRQLEERTKSSVS